MELVFGLFCLRGRVRTAGLHISTWAVILVGACLFFNNPAFAQLNACNKSNAKIQVAVGSEASANVWVSNGWFSVDPGACTTVVGGPPFTNRYFYIYADGDDGENWSGGDRSADFCVSNDVFNNLADNTPCALGYDQKSFLIIDVGDSDTFEFDFTSTTNPYINISTGVIQQKCLISYYDSYNVDHVDTEITCTRQAVKTVMKKLEHCVQLTVTGPVDIQGVAKQYVNDCVNDALNKDKTLRIVESIGAIATDVVAEDGGATTAALLISYIDEISNDTISCLTDTDRIDERIGQVLQQKFNATVVKESHWVYWDL